MIYCTQLEKKISRENMSLLHPVLFLLGRYIHIETDVISKCQKNAIKSFKNNSHSSFATEKDKNECQET